jgi:ABC-type antimicrobial peptide transport system permease subunit
MRQPVYMGWYISHCRYTWAGTPVFEVAHVRQGSAVSKKGGSGTLPTYTSGCWSGQSYTPTRSVPTKHRTPWSGIGPGPFNFSFWILFSFSFFSFYLFLCFVFCFLFYLFKFQKNQILELLKFEKYQI